LPNRLNEVIDRFNSAAEELQNSEFRGTRTPNEWERMFQARHARDYTKLFTAVDPLIEAFVVANPSERARISSRLTPAALGILGTFASSMPVLAVRRASPMLITQGLRALAIIGEATISGIGLLTLQSYTMRQRSWGSIRYSCFARLHLWRPRHPFKMLCDPSRCGHPKTGTSRPFGFTRH